MRTRTEDLLSIRDDEPMDAELRARLLADSDCLAEIDRLREVRESMRRLPQLEPPPDCWENIVSATVDR
ncbi:MAG: hypothetical protein JXB36_03850, partial [Gammaproteobacteria bacterium]|nr:hypothetical protein [Gammaproteobacteria bacterium]